MQKDDKRIAKNTVVLYVRMIITILVSLYASRVVLQVLGVDDFGIFGLVGGVVSMLSFLNASMSGATSRFITYALGQDDITRVNETFSTSVNIHFFIALLVLIVAETIGLWFVLNKLVLPESRYWAAICVYQCSVLSAIATILQTPYNASIIANERMDAFAYIEVFNVIMKLIIVLILPILPFDKLITYSLLYLVVSVVVMLTYRIYCKKKFSTCKYHFKINKSIMIPMISYSSWDLFGNLSSTMKQQGTNILINMFFGVVFNASSSIATQVQSAISGLAANVIQAFRPQIIKKYASGNITVMQEQMCNALRFTLIIYNMCVLPLFMDIEYVFNIWLGEVPKSAIDFSKLLLLNSLINLVTMIIITVNHAAGKIKYISFITGMFNLIYLLSVYISYKFVAAQVESAYTIMVLFSLIILVIDLYITNTSVNFYR